MGIYTNGQIYGIRIITFIEDESHILFERMSDKILDSRTLNEAKQFYDGLADKNGIHFRVYNQCSTTYGDGVVSLWFEMSLEEFMEIL